MLTEAWLRGSIQVCCEDHRTRHHAIVPSRDCEDPVPLLFVIPWTGKGLVLGEILKGYG